MQHLLTDVNIITVWVIGVVLLTVLRGYATEYRGRIPDDFDFVVILLWPAALIFYSLMGIGYVLQKLGKVIGEYHKSLDT